MNAAKKKQPALHVATRYYKTTNVNGELQFQIQEYTTARLTPMHERIRNYYPAQTRIGTVSNMLGCLALIVIDEVIASKDWIWAHEQAIKQYRAKRRLGAAPKCADCGRVFDIANAYVTTTDAAEWAYGHDCEAQTTSK